MVCDVRNIFYIGRHKWVVSLKVASICLLGSIPLNGICFEDKELPDSQKIANEILNQVDTQNLDPLFEEFDKLEKIFDASTDPIDEGRQFLRSFINEINTRYGLTLTLRDACKLVRENLNNLNLPEELQKIILNTIELYEFDPGSTE